MKARSIILIVISSIVALVMIFGMWSIGVNNSVKRMENDLDFRYNEIQIQRSAGDVRISGFIAALHASDSFTSEVISEIQSAFQEGGVIKQAPDGGLFFYAPGETFPNPVAISDIAESHREMYTNFTLNYNTEMNSLQRHVTSYNSLIKDYRNKFVTFPNSMFLGSKSADPKFQLEGFPIIIQLDHGNIELRP